MENFSESQATLNDIVFEKRNKAYGAFFLRKIYGKHVSTALLVGISVFCIALASPLIYNKLNSGKEEVLVMREVDLTLFDAPPINPETPPPPPPPAKIEPPKLDMVKFLEPEIKPDELVVEPPPPVEVLVESNAGEITQVGDFNLNELIVDGTGDEAIGDVSDEPLLFVEENPEFQGDLRDFMLKNLRYPKKAETLGIEGKVYVRFVVNRDGSISDVAVQKGIPGYGLDEEAVRVVKLMPAWKPGKNNGVPAKVQYSIPISFRLD